MSYSRREAIERRRQNWRIILGTIIVVTLPFYCAGLFLWGTAPPRSVTPTAAPSLPGQATVTSIIIVTATPEQPAFATITPLPITLELPTQSFSTVIAITPPPTPITPTRFLSPTPTFPPTSTPVPPTNPPPPTAVLITDTPLPFDPAPPSGP